MSDHMETLKLAAEKLRSAIELLKASDMAGADRDTDAAHDQMEVVREALMTELTKLSNPSPERDKIDLALTGLDEINGELEEMGSFSESEEEFDVQEVVDTLEGYLNTLNEIAL